LSFLSFILFASWFAGSQIPVTRYPELGVTGLLSFFGGANLAIPYLLDSFKLSTDYFQLYMVAGIVNGYFATMAASMQLVCFTLICSYWMAGKSHFSIKRLISNGTMSLVSVIIIIITIKIYLASTTNSTMSKKNILDGMTIKNPVEFTISKTKDSRSIEEKLFEKQNRPHRLESIKKSGVLHVGFNPNTMPFVFYNSKHKLVGYDIQMAHNLARILECKIEFIPFEMPDMADSLKNNIFDIAMTGVYIGLNRIDEMDFTDSYMEINPAVIIKDYDKKKYHDVNSIKNAGKIKVAVLKGSLFVSGIKKVFKNAEVVEIENYKDFFDGKIKADILVHSAEQGYTWTLLYPEYTVVILNELKHKTRVAYAIAKGDLAFLKYLNYWIQNMKLNNITEDNYKYWILGEVPELKKPRWCIARDVLHWME
jgi:ABC-type amino acid transport substrate-binding protein